MKQKEDLNKFNKYFEDEQNTERETDKDIRSRWDKIQPKHANNDYAVMSSKLSIPKQNLKQRSARHFKKKNLYYSRPCRIV